MSGGRRGAGGGAKEEALRAGFVNADPLSLSYLSTTPAAVSYRDEHRAR